MKLNLGLRLELFIWSENLEAFCQQAAGPWTVDIWVHNHAIRSWASLTRPNFLPILSVGAVRNHV